MLGNYMKWRRGQYHNGVACGSLKTRLTDQRRSHTLPRCGTDFNTAGQSIRRPNYKAATTQVPYNVNIWLGDRLHTERSLDDRQPGHDSWLSELKSASQCFRPSEISLRQKRQHLPVTSNRRVQSVASLIRHCHFAVAEDIYFEPA